MTGFSRSRSWCLRYLLSMFFASISLQLVSALPGNNSSSKNGATADTHGSSGRNNGPKIALILVAILVVGLFSFFLFKFWQKKKRDEQYARLLKLFEEDDELEVELGLRD